VPSVKDRTPMLFQVIQLKRWAGHVSDLMDCACEDVADCLQSHQYPYRENVNESESVQLYLMRFEVKFLQW